MVNIRNTCVVLQECLAIPALFDKASEPEKIEALESRFASRGVLAIWEDLNLSSVLFGKAFRLETDCERVSNFATQQHRPKTIQ